MKNKAKKNVKQKTFFFEDYTESKIDTKNKNLIKNSLSRISFLFFIFLCFAFVFSAKIFYLSLKSEKNFIIKNNNKNFIETRIDITDRNGIILARNIDVYDAGIRPKLVKDKKKY